LNKLAITEFKDIRVLTTQQLSEEYGTTDKAISNNFNNNDKRYEEGKHYILLQGEELKDFKSKSLNLGIAPNTNKFYLWTEKGAFLHAKSLNTDKAWEVYEVLVDTYFKAKELVLPETSLSPELQMFGQLFKAIANNELATNQALANSQHVISQLEGIREVITLDITSWRDEVNKLLKKIGTALGGGEQYGTVREESYKLFSNRMGYDLKIRLTNRKKTMALEGATKTKINNTSYLDIIASEKRMVECYVTIVKEMAIKYGVA